MKLKWILLGVSQLLIFGALLPWLLSFPSDVAMILGILVLLLDVLGLAWVTACYLITKQRGRK